MKGRKLGRSNAHRKAMFQNMAASLILTMRPDDDSGGPPRVLGRIVTTVAKAKELRPKIEKLVTLARKGRRHERAAEELLPGEARGTAGWTAWRQGDGWQQWVRAKAPAVAARRRAFAILRNKEAVDILFDEIAEQFADRPGGYTRIVRLPNRRLGDGGQQALIEFTGPHDRQRLKRATVPRVRDEEPLDETSSEPETPEPATAEPSAEAVQAPEDASDDAGETEPNAGDVSSQDKPAT